MKKRVGGVFLLHASLLSENYNEPITDSTLPI